MKKMKRHKSVHRLSPSGTWTSSPGLASPLLAPLMRGDRRQRHHKLIFCGPCPNSSHLLNSQGRRCFTPQQLCIHYHADLRHDMPSRHAPKSLGDIASTDPSTVKTCCSKDCCYHLLSDHHYSQYQHYLLRRPGVRTDSPIKSPSIRAVTTTLGQDRL